MSEKNIRISDELLRTLQLLADKLADKTGRNTSVDQLAEVFLKKAIGNSEDLLKESDPATESDRSESEDSSENRIYRYPENFKGMSSGLSVVREQHLRCPFDEFQFTVPVLRSKTVISEFDKFRMNVYKRAINPKYSFIDYSLHYIKICPNCLYASDMRGFYAKESDFAQNKSKDGWRKPDYFRNPASYSKIMMDNVQKRHSIAEQSGNVLRMFSVDRTEADAITACLMASDAVETILRMSAQSDERGILFYRRGLFFLSAARHCENLGLDGKYHDYLEQCLQSFAESDTTVLGLKDYLIFYLQYFEVAKLLQNESVMAEAKNTIVKCYQTGYIDRKSTYSDEDKILVKQIYKQIDLG